MMPQVLHVSDAAVQEVENYALKVGLDPDVMAEQALAAGLATLRKLRFFEPRSTQANVADALEVLDKGGNAEPMPGDDLPEAYIPFNQRRRA